MKMIDRLLRDGFRLPGTATQVFDKTELAGIHNDLLGAVCVDASNIEAYVRSLAGSQPSGPAGWADLIPNGIPVVPPWPLCFIETGAVRIKTMTNSPARLRPIGGVLIRTEEVDNETVNPMLRSMSNVSKGMTPFGKIIEPELRDPVRWAVSFLSYFQDGPPPDVFGPIGRGSVFLTPDGSIARWKGGDHAMLIFFPGAHEPIVLHGDDGAPMDVNMGSLYSGMCQAFMAIWMFACAFANCKNVVIVDEEPKHPSRQARRLAERRGDPPLVKFKTLRIDPNHRRRVSENSRVVLPKRDLPLHIVRGHFSHYTEDRPLFGKYAGTFWVPAHIRGSDDIGIVGKDYRVLPGDTA